MFSFFKKFFSKSKPCPPDDGGLSSFLDKRNVEIERLTNERLEMLLLENQQIKEQNKNLLGIQTLISEEYCKMRTALIYLIDEEQPDSLKCKYNKIKNIFENYDSGVNFH